MKAGMQDEIERFRGSFDKLVMMLAEIVHDRDQAVTRVQERDREIQALKAELHRVTEERDELIRGPLPACTRAEVLDILQCDRSSLYRWIKKGLFPPPVGDRWPRNIVNAWYAAHVHPSGPPPKTPPKEGLVLVRGGKRK